ncbi:hypothetical protein VKT23_016253 [Stygiomarasmius scandens]|uniref:Uncharacterized protein n=1 Tax=Marasmiellus scandens TaxID=2682957 RepID=A0ABR1J009_9AGAR
MPPSTMSEIGLCPQFISSSSRQSLCNSPIKFSMVLTCQTQPTARATRSCTNNSDLHPPLDAEPSRTKRGRSKKKTSDSDPKNTFESEQTLPGSEATTSAALEEIQRKDDSESVAPATPLETGDHDLDAAVKEKDDLHGTNKRVQEEMRKFQVHQFG